MMGDGTSVSAAVWTDGVWSWSVSLSEPVAEEKMASYVIQVMKQAG